MNYKTNKKLPIIAACDGCGVCCLHMGYPPFVRPDPTQNRNGEKWWLLLPEELRSELDQFIAKYDHKTYSADVASFDGPCCWFDLETRQCKHHQHRPNVCRDFETGSQQCREWRDFYREQINTRSLSKS